MLKSPLNQERFSIKNVADVNSIDSFASKRYMEDFSVVITKRFRSNWFEKTKRRHARANGSHGHKRIQHPNAKKSSKPRPLQYTFNDLLSNIQKPLGIHHIRTILFSLPVNYLKDLRDFFYVNILQCFFVVENYTANAVSVTIGDNGNRLIC
jgi:hypothetical protein